MVDCPGLGQCEGIYLFDSIINLGMIWVKFDQHQNEFHKVLSSNYNFSIDSIPTREGKATNFYQPGATRAENDSLFRGNTSGDRVVRYDGEIFNPTILPSNVNMLEQDAYLHQQGMNNLCFHERSISQIMKHGKCLQTWITIS